MAQVIQIKRSTSTAAPSSLAAGELAYSSNSDFLYIGHPDGTTGPITIAGLGMFQQTAGADNGSDVSYDYNDLLDIVGATVANTSSAIASNAPIATYISKNGDDITLAIDHTVSGVTAGTYGSTTAIPSFTVDSRGHITNVTTNNVATALTVDAVDESSTVTTEDVNLLSDDLRIVGATNQIQTSVAKSGTDVTLTASFVTDPIISGDLQINGNDIKDSGGSAAITFDGSQNVTVAGDLTVAGNDIKSSGGTTALTLSGANVTVQGDLTVEGTTTTVNSTVVELGDNIILLNREFDDDPTNSGTPSAPTANAGFEVNRDTFGNVKVEWNETADFWQITERDVTVSSTAASTIAAGASLNDYYLLSKNNFTYHIQTLDGGTF